MKQQVGSLPHAIVETAVSLNDTEKATISAFITEQGFTGDVTYTVNRKVLGGIRIDVGDWVYDTTLKEKLAALVSTLA
jgi:F0F1-type ATP synthase delta subunit